MQFPSKYAPNTQHLLLLKDSLIARANYLETQEEKYIDQEFEIQKKLILRNQPLCFNPYSDRNCLRMADKNFHTVVALLEENGVHRPAELSVLDWEYKLIYLEEKNKAKLEQG